MRTYGSLAERARAQKLKSAKAIFWFIGILVILVNGVPLLDMEGIENKVDSEIAEQGLTAAKIQRLPEDRRAEFERRRTNEIQKRKLLLGASVAMGLIFIACAIFVRRKPVMATVTALVLYLGITATILAFNPDFFTGNKVGLGVRIAIIIGMISAVKTALAVERQDRVERELDAV